MSSAWRGGGGGGAVTEWAKERRSQQGLERKVKPGFRFRKEKGRRKGLAANAHPGKKRDIISTNTTRERKRCPSLLFGRKEKEKGEKS